MKITASFVMPSKKIRLWPSLECQHPVSYKLVVSLVTCKRFSFVLVSVTLICIQGYRGTRRPKTLPLILGLGKLDEGNRSISSCTSEWEGVN